MDQELKTRWVDALRSGDYPQGFGRLRRPNTNGIHSYCPLGVLADVRYGSGGWGPDNDLIVGNGTLGTVGQLSSFVLQDVGLSENAQSKLIDLNDEGRASFSEIADWIEENV